MAHAGKEPGIPQHEGWINTCKARKQAAQNNPFILAFFLAFSPFILGSQEEALSRGIE